MIAGGTAWIRRTRNPIHPSPTAVHGIHATERGGPCADGLVGAPMNPERTMPMMLTKAVRGARSGSPPASPRPDRSAPRFHGDTDGADGVVIVDEGAARVVRDAYARLFGWPEPPSRAAVPTRSQDQPQSGGAGHDGPRALMGTGADRS